MRAPSVSFQRGIVVDCAKCGVMIPEGREISLLSKDRQNVTICPPCASTSLIAKAVQDEREDPNLTGAILLGLGAAVISSILWYAAVILTNYQLGVVAIAVGWIVAQAIMQGAGGKRGPRLQMLSVATTVLALVMSEYLVVPHFMVQEGYALPLFLPPEAMFALVVGGVKAEPATLVFWGIALWEAYTLPAARRLNQDIS